MKRSVERVEGVKRVSLDLATGQVRVLFDDRSPPTPAKLWQAVRDSGFTPQRMELKGQVYQPPEP